MISRIVLALSILISASIVAVEKPHIILVMADDQGWGDMAFMGHPDVVTPNFDKAAAEGLRFDKFYAAAPVCSPTRASVMTGRTPNRMSVYKWGHPMRPQETTIAEALKTAGYSTSHFGKWHLGSVRKTSPANPGANGFDHWISAPNYYDNNSPLSDNGTAIVTDGESSIVAVDFAINWMKKELKKDAPLFSVIWFGSPHAPYRAAAEDKALYPNQPEDMQNFLGEITGMDRAFGKLRGALGDMGIRENTILWYCSDNGALPKVGSTGGHRGVKGKIYDGGLLVPAILEWPAEIKKPVTTNIRANTFDIYPTLLEIAGVTIENQAPLDGESLVPLIEGKVSKRSRAMGFWDAAKRGVSTPSDVWMTELLEAQKAGKDLPPPESSQHPETLPNPPESLDSLKGHAAWISGDWKLHRIIDKKSNKLTWELYDLKADSFEEKDLVDSEFERTKKMQAELETWMKSVTDSINGEDY